MTTPRRRWFAFSLRTLFVVVTAFCVWLGWNLRIVRERQAIRDEIEAIARNVIEERERTGESLTICEASMGFLTLKEAARTSYGEEEVLSKFAYVKVPLIRRLLGDESIGCIVMPAAANPALIERAEYAFPEAMLYMANRTHEYQAVRDSLYAPPDNRQPNTGNVFKTGIIKK